MLSSASSSFGPARQRRVIADMTTAELCQFLQMRAGCSETILAAIAAYQLTGADLVAELNSPNSNYHSNSSSSLSPHKQQQQQQQYKRKRTSSSSSSQRSPAKSFFRDFGAFSVEAQVMFGFNEKHVAALKRFYKNYVTPRNALEQTKIRYAEEEEEREELQQEEQNSLTRTTTTTTSTKLASGSNETVAGGGAAAHCSENENEEEEEEEEEEKEEQKQILFSAITGRVLIESLTVAELITLLESNGINENVLEAIVHHNYSGANFVRPSFIASAFGPIALAQHRFTQADVQHLSKIRKQLLFREQLEVQQKQLLEAFAAMRSHLPASWNEATPLDRWEGITIDEKDASVKMINVAVIKKSLLLHDEDESEEDDEETEEEPEEEEFVSETGTSTADNDNEEEEERNENQTDNEMNEKHSCVIRASTVVSSAASDNDSNNDNKAGKKKGRKLKRKTTTGCGRRRVDGGGGGGGGGSDDIDLTKLSQALRKEIILQQCLHEQKLSLLAAFEDVQEGLPESWRVSTPLQHFSGVSVKITYLSTAAVERINEQNKIKEQQEKRKYYQNLVTASPTTATSHGSFRGRPGSNSLQSQTQKKSISKTEIPEIRISVNLSREELLLQAASSSSHSPSHSSSANKTKNCGKKSKNENENNNSNNNSNNRRINRGLVGTINFAALPSGLSALFLSNNKHLSGDCDGWTTTTTTNASTASTGATFSAKCKHLRELLLDHCAFTGTLSLLNLPPSLYFCDFRHNRFQHLRFDAAALPMPLKQGGTLLITNNLFQHATPLVGTSFFSTELNRKVRRQDAMSGDGGASGCFCYESGNNFHVKQQREEEEGNNFCSCTRSRVGKHGRKHNIKWMSSSAGRGGGGGGGEEALSASDSPLASSLTSSPASGADLLDVTIRSVESAAGGGASATAAGSPGSSPVFRVRHKRTGQVKDYELYSACLFSTP